ncbi:MAG: hypothetical protein AB1758_22140 [Candidatus Eremiobacterota bacterium]
MSITLFLGYPSNPSLGLLHQHALRRSDQRVVFLDLNDYPRELPFYLRVTRDGTMDGCLYPRREAPVPLSEVSCVYAHNLAISPDARPGLTEDDWKYTQAECWATVTVLLEALRLGCPVANFIRSRRDTESRLSRLAVLTRHGLPVARCLVTSRSTSAHRFFSECRGRVRYSAIMGVNPSQAMGEDDLARLALLQHAPAFFESVPKGELSWLAIVAGEAFSCPDHAPPPDPVIVSACLAAARSLDLTLAEVALRRLPNGTHQVVDMATFLSPGILQNRRVLQAALNLSKGALVA